MNAGKDLAAAAHRFAGSSEMFGFHRVGAAARAFERAVQARSPELPAAIERLCAALEGFFEASLSLQPDQAKAAPDAVPPAAPAQADAPRPSAFDRAGFESTASFLEPEAIIEYLASLAGQGEALLEALRTQDEAGELAAEAHRFAGSAEMFGFTGAGGAAREFERAAQARAPELPQHIDALRAELQRFLADIRQLHDECASDRGNGGEARSRRTDPVPAGS